MRRGQSLFEQLDVHHDLIDHHRSGRRIHNDQAALRALRAHWRFLRPSFVLVSVPVLVARVAMP